MSKRTIYISLFTLLGILLSFLLHAAIEISLLKLFVKDFDKYGLGLSWDSWYIIHHIISVILFILGITVGLKQGKFWWRVIYIEHRFRK